MKVLITGATGLVGQKLAASLLAQKIDVNFLTTRKDSAIPNCKAFYWNPTTNEFDAASLVGVDVLIHLAGASIAGSWSDKGKQLIIDSRVESTAFLVQQLQLHTHQIKKVVAASAIGIYDDLQVVQTEDKFVQSTNFLGRVVDLWEDALHRFSSCNIEVCIMRIGLVLERTQGALPPMTKVVKYGIGSVLGTGKQYYSWIHIDDLIGIFSFAITSKLQGVYNCVGPAPATNAAFTQTLASVLHRKIWLPAIPKWVMKLALGEKAILVLEGQNVSAQKIQNAGYVFQYTSLKQALSQIYKK